MGVLDDGGAVPSWLCQAALAGAWLAGAMSVPWMLFILWFPDGRFGDNARQPARDASRASFDKHPDDVVHFLVLGRPLAVVVVDRQTQVFERASGEPELHPMNVATGTIGSGGAVATQLFGLGNFSSTLLILRASVLLNRHGRSAVHAAAIAVLLYAGLNAANAVAAYPAGAIADRIGRRPVIIAGIVTFGVACVAFAFGSASIAVLAVLFVIVGASTAMVETAQSAYAAGLVDDRLRGRAFGLLGLVEGVGDLASSVTVGILFTLSAPAWAFAFGAAAAGAGALVLIAPDA